MKCEGCNGEKSELTRCPVCGKMLCIYCREADAVEHQRYPAEWSKNAKVTVRIG